MSRKKRSKEKNKKSSITPVYDHTSQRNTGFFHNVIQVLFTQDIGKLQFKLLVGYSVIAVLLEFAAFSIKGVFSVIASRLWMLGWIICLIGIVYRFICLVKEDLKATHHISYLFLAVIFAMLILASVNFDKIVIGQDATQQMAAGARSFSVPDWNYTGKAFLNYPNRQYVLAAIPTLVLGRSIPALQIGFAYPFFLGLLLLYTGFRSWVKSEGLPGIFAVVGISAIFVFPYVTEYYIYFEHTLYPVCFTMQCTGWLLLFLKKPSLFHAFAIMWTCGMMANCYTPAIASVALFICVIFLLGFFTLSSKNKLPYQRLEGNLFFWTCVDMSAVSCLFAAFTFLFGRGDRITETRASSIAESLSATKEGYSIFFLNKPSVFTSYLVVFIIIYLVLSLLYRFGFIHLVVSVWVLGIIGMSQFLKGYAVYAPSVSMSRALITVPVLVTALFLTGCDTIKRQGVKIKPLILILLVCVNLGFGTYNIFTPVVQGDAEKYFNPATIQPMKYIVRDMAATIRESESDGQARPSVVLYTNNVWLKNLRDYTVYFLPDTAVYVLEKGKPLPDEAARAVVYWDGDTAPFPVDKYEGNIEAISFNLSDEKPFRITRFYKFK